METSKMKREDLIQFLEKAKKGELPKGSTVFLKVDNQYYRKNLETPITSEQFKKEFRTGIDSLFEVNSTDEEENEILKDFGIAPNVRNPMEEATVIKDLIEKLENE